MTTKVEFWSDHLPETPNTIFRNLSDESIEKRATKALEDFDGDADIWACRTTINKDVWETHTFCFIKIDGVVTKEIILDNI